MRILKTILLLALAPTVLLAQNGEDYRAKVNKRIAAMRKAMREGKVVRYNVRVRVKFKNGNRLEGVVKNGRFVELVDGLDFVTSANRTDPGAGLRVWYTSGTNSFIFVNYTDIARYKIGRKLTNAQVRAIEKNLAAAKREAMENYKRLHDAKKDPVDENKTDPDQGKTEPESGPQLTAEEKKLLEEFPPAAGWSENKLNRLKLERITIGRFPNEEERRFVENFTAWHKAFKKSQEVVSAKKKAGSGVAKKSQPAPGSSTSGGTPKPEPAQNTPPMPGPKK